LKYCLSSLRPPFSFHWKKEVHWKVDELKACNGAILEIMEALNLKPVNSLITCPTHKKKAHPK